MTDVLATALTERLGCRLPVIQTAMGWIATPQLVAATSNAGAFGFLAGAVMKPADSKAIFFVARGDGSSEFSETLAEHNTAVNRFIRKLADKAPSK